ncbi:hypothetical protein BKA93DRAFT_148884 [Sparassis latifolia]
MAQSVNSDFYDPLEGRIPSVRYNPHDPESVAYNIAASYKRTGKSTKNSSTPPLFALIIGINYYKSDKIGDLRGAVPDANAIQNFLENDLGVPRDHIRNLRNKKATKGDPILIFYAGHGGSAPAPDGWQGPKIEMLLPCDCEELDNVWSNVIPDRTFASLLDRLAEAKGDNITVILDCCHSSSGTRGDNAECMVRGIDILDSPSPDLDRQIWGATVDGKRASQPAPGFARSGLRSHVLLAACGAGERAQEFNKRGRFTQAILERLSMAGTANITYKELIQQITPWEEQNPQCEGYNQGRVVFNSKAPNLRRMVFEVRWEGEKYVMKAGAAHGVTDGARFAIYKDRSVTSNTSPLGHLTAQKVDEFTTILATPPGAPLFDHDSIRFASQTHASMSESLRVHLDEKLADLFDELNVDPSTEHRSVEMVDKADAELDVTLENGSVVFDVLDEEITQFRFKRLPHEVEPVISVISLVIRDAAHYYWHLRRTNLSHPLRDHVNLEFTKLTALKDQFGDFLQPITTPIGENLVGCDKVVRLVIDDDSSMYGIKITNKSNIPMFASLFYFDNSDFSISTYYQTPTGAGRVDTPLPPNGTLTIGYGSGGAVPFSYFLREGQDVDVGLLKLFLSTKHVDLSYVPVQSVLSFRESGQPQRHTTVNKPEEITSTWDTLTIPIVQLRPQPEKMSSA